VIGESGRGTGERCRVRLGLLIEGVGRQVNLHGFTGTNIDFPGLSLVREVGILSGDFDPVAPGLEL
jgi:hypothetical protein